MPFGQLVVGPPGSGKSTYCAGMKQFMSAIGRKCSIVNLDPGNEQPVYHPCEVDVRDLVALEDVMDEEHLGPNGAAVYSLEVLEQNLHWLEQELKALGDDYILFDCPGQVELITHHCSIRNIFSRLEKKLDFRLVVVHLIDAHYCTDPAKYISTLLLSLRTMLQLEFPHVNVLSKIDLVSQYGQLDFNLDFYTEVQDLQYLLPLLEQDPRMKKYASLNQTICDVVTDFGLVSFETCAVEDKKSMTRLLQVIDHAGGYAFGPAEGAGDNIWQLAVRGGWAQDQSVFDVQERWIDRKEEFDAAEENQWKEQQEQQMKDEEQLHNNGL